MLSRNRALHCNILTKKVIQCALHASSSANVNKDGSKSLNHVLFEADKNVYDHMYPWKNAKDFANVIYNRVVYNDKKIIAIDKPWNVSVFTTNSKTIKDPQYLLSQVSGTPKYCINDVLPQLCERLELPELHLLASIDRQMSGLTLFTTDQNLKDNYKKSKEYSTTNFQPYLGFECITYGYPTSEYVKEKVGFLKKSDKDGVDYVIGDVREAHKGAKGYKTHVEMQVMSINRSLSTCYMKLNVNRLRWHFPRVYISNICSCILGDIRFSSKVGTTLGTKILLPTKRNTFDFEPLSPSILNLLQVDSNKSIPLMLHLSEIRLPNFYKKKQNLIIKTNRLPEHFEWTLKKLNLVN